MSDAPPPPGRFPHDLKLLGAGLGVSLLLVGVAWGIHTGRVGIGVDAIEVFLVLTPLCAYLLLKGLVGFDLVVALGLTRVVERLKRR